MKKRIAILCTLFTLSTAGLAQVPPYMTLLNHGDVDRTPNWNEATNLQACLAKAVDSPDYQNKIAQGEFGVSVVDLTHESDSEPARLASINPFVAIYAASVPKIAAMASAFQMRKDIREGRMAFDSTNPGHQTMFTPEMDFTTAFWGTLQNMIQWSDNTSATQVIKAVSFNFIASYLWQTHLYDMNEGGGLWIGRTYAGAEVWHRDPINDISHDATAYSLAKFFTLLGEERLVDAESSRQMKALLADSPFDSKFVKGLRINRPGSKVFRKVGSWHSSTLGAWDHDAALIERGNIRYAAAALCYGESCMDDLADLIVKLDDCVVSTGN